jgi:hypothetical protein
MYTIYQHLPHAKEFLINLTAMPANKVVRYFNFYYRIVSHGGHLTTSKSSIVERKAKSM